jgi:4-amino-4-deoxy-L-arabinose transferase-like glycosyltransferase
LAATLPWYLAVALISHGRYVRFAIGTQIVQRLTSGMEEHGAFPGYYALFSALAFYPWSVLVPAAAWGAWTRRKTSADLGFLLGWMIGPWLLLECLPTRMIHYYLPAYPACALLVAWMVKTLAAEELGLRRWPLGRLCLGLFGGIGIATTVGLAAAAVTAPGHLRLPLAVLAVVLGAGTLAAMLSLQRGLTTRAVHSLIGAWGIILLAAGGWLIPAAEMYRMSRRVGEQLSAYVQRTGIEPVLLNYQEPGLIHAMGRPVATVRDRDGFYELLDRKGTLVSVITPEERPELAEKYALEVSVVESLEGFSLTKGRTDTLQLAILRRDRKVVARAGSPPRTASIQQPLVK